MATVPFVFECSKESGFVTDPNEHKRFGYILALNGFGLAGPLDADLTVNVPFNTGAKPTYSTMATAFTAGDGLGQDTVKPMASAQVVGVFEKFEWNGGVGDPLQLDFFVSQENAMQIKALQQLALKTTMITALDWWIADYDQEVKTWFEQSNPIGGPIKGIITGKENPELNVDLNPVVVKDGIDVNVYKISLKVAPGANLQYTLHFANSDKKKTVKSWGLKVGKLAATALGDK